MRVEWAEGVLSYPEDTFEEITIVFWVRIGLDSIKAALYGQWATNGEIFTGFISTHLVPQLRAGDSVLMDNISFHKSVAVKEAVESVGARIAFLPPYSPDYSPIECMWSKIKSVLRKYAPDTERQFKKAIKVAFESITQNDLMNGYRHCGYEA